RGELDVRYGTVDAEDILEQIRIVFDRHPVSRGKSLRLLCLSLETQFESDPRLLMRILINMVKNAFESVPRSGTIKLRYERIDGAPVFTVWNPGKIPEDVAAQIFQRSFSTRHETGRGLGTYSMRLLGNQYLGGTVTFTTSEEVGTEFALRLPAGTPVRA
ncbi:MAG: ATP-binding protein, partial [Phycisphaerales bacterium]|nr:ATP-binding protein [Phycisphaerales bacterium]